MVEFIIVVRVGYKNHLGLTFSSMSSVTALQQIFALARVRGVTPCLAAVGQRAFFSQASKATRAGENAK